MCRRTWFVAIGLSVLFTPGAIGKPDGAVPPIDIVDAMPEKNVSKDAVWTKPIVIKSAKEAARYFGKAGLAVLTKEVDFKKQYVLVFAWTGSSKDELLVLSAEGVEEQLTFALQPGTTRDRRSHTVVFALRSNVIWGTTKGATAPPAKKEK